MRAVLLLLACAASSGCADLDSTDEIVDITPSDGKADGEATATMELGPGKSARFLVQCQEILYCDVTLQVSGWPSSWPNTHATEAVRLGTVTMEAALFERTNRSGEVWVQPGSLSGELTLITRSVRNESYEIVLQNVYDEPVEFTVFADWI